MSYSIYSPWSVLLMRRCAWSHRKGAPLMLSTSAAQAQLPLTPAVLLHRIRVTFIWYRAPLYVGTVSPSIDTVSPTIRVTMLIWSSFRTVLLHTPTPLDAWLLSHAPSFGSLTYDSLSHPDHSPGRMNRPLSCWLYYTHMQPLSPCHQRLAYNGKYMIYGYGLSKGLKIII